MLAALVVLAGCSLEPSPTPLPTAPPTATHVASTPATVEPTASPQPAFTLPLPPTTDPRVIGAEVAPSDDGLLVTVTNTTDSRIDELVLRWTTELDAVFFIAPFVPSEDRIRENGPPLVQEWTKWVVGPGERGEPAGTTSLGYGPLMPGATLAIPLHVDRVVPGSIAFDLQLLAGNDILALDDGGPAVLRIDVP